MTREFMGRGWKFPVKVDKLTGRIQMSRYEEDIEEAIKIILGTQKGERVMEPEFGCNAKEYVFENTDITTLTMMKTDMEEALMRWEPRIEDVDIEINTDSVDKGRLDINISYAVRKTNNLYNMVYPFFINEGAE